jgi:hypothetical protein
MKSYMPICRYLKCNYHNIYRSGKCLEENFRGLFKHFIATFCKPYGIRVLDVIKKISFLRAKFEILTAVAMKVAVCSDVTTCSLVVIYRRFRGSFCIHHRSRRARVSIHPIRMCDTICHTTVLFILRQRLLNLAAVEHWCFVSCSAAFASEVK